jgi:hypothetical protein
MRTCHSCGTENRETSRYCKECATLIDEPLQLVKPGRKVDRREAVFYLFVGCLAVAVLAGGIAALAIFRSDRGGEKSVLQSAEDLLNTISGAEGEDGKAAKQEKRSVPAKPCEMGEEVRAGGLVLKATGLSRSGGSGIERPLTGNEFAVVQISVRNAGEGSVVISSLLQMCVTDRSGRVYHAGLYFPAGRLEEGELEGGRTVAGKVAFEVPAKTKDLYFVFDADPLDKTRAVAVKLF